MLFSSVWRAAMSVHSSHRGGAVKPPHLPSNWGNFNTEPLEVCPHQGIQMGQCPSPPPRPLPPFKPFVTGARDALGLHPARTELNISHYYKMPRETSAPADKKCYCSVKTSIDGAI